MEIAYSRETGDLHLYLYMQTDHEEPGSGKTFSQYFVKTVILFLGDALWQKDIPHILSSFVFNFLFTLASLSDSSLKGPLSRLKRTKQAASKIARNLK